MPFKNDYASFYDLLYHDKDYAQESRYIISVLNNHHKTKIQNILDIACGTGSHAFNLAKNKLTVVASDFSKDMIAVAKKKKVTESNPQYLSKNMVRLGQVGNFDAVICMFAALNYLTTYNDLELVLRNVAKNLKKDGLFMCDIWNGLAILTQKPSTRIKYVTNPDIVLVRSSESTVNPVSHICNVEFKLTVFKKGSDMPKTYQERHRLRFFFPEEIRYVFLKNHFEIIDMHPFLKPKKKITENDWNVTVVAKKI
jgi:2-polyprenyl-3-methyl-5-hydroxy-6-metoxy-1,4-benzoquinol methylase